MGVQKVTRENGGDVHVPGWVIGWVASGNLSTLDFQVWILLAWAYPRPAAEDFLNCVTGGGVPEIRATLAKLEEFRMAERGAGEGIGGWLVIPHAPGYRKPGP